MAAIRQPILMLPGNHDDRDAFWTAFADHRHLLSEGPLHFAVGDNGPVRVIGLDVTVPGEHHCDATDKACEWLHARLAEEPDRKTIVMMHQPPFASGIACIDAYRGSERLATVLSTHPNVERRPCGHVHRFMLARFAGTVLVTAPSTTTAIALRLRLEAEPASYV